MERTRQFFICILRYADSSDYVGHTEDIEQRVTDHKNGKGAAWTAARSPVVLLYQESHPDLASAVRRELQLKKWSRAKKEALTAGDLENLRN